MATGILRPHFPFSPVTFLENFMDHTKSPKASANTACRLCPIYLSKNSRIVQKIKDIYYITGIILVILKK
jgi:hypothetical protein